MGIHPKIVSEMLWHSSVSITLDTYNHVIPGLGEVAVSAIEDALGHRATVSSVRVAKNNADGEGV
jgi:integrase